MSVMPGQSGNPSGRPKRLPFTEIAEALAEQPLPKLAHRIRERLLDCGIDPDTATWGEVLIRAQFFEALKGSTKAFKEIVDRIEGKAVQRVEVAGSFSGIDITVHYIKPSKSDSTEH